MSVKSLQRRFLVNICLGFSLGRTWGESGAEGSTSECGRTMSEKDTSGTKTQRCPSMIFTTNSLNKHSLAQVITLFPCLVVDTPVAKFHCVVDASRPLRGLSRLAGGAPACGLVTLRLLHLGVTAPRGVTPVTAASAPPAHAARHRWDHWQGASAASRDTALACRCRIWKCVCLFWTRGLRSLQL